MLIIANTSSSQNKISTFLVFLSLSLQKKKNISRAFTPKKVLGVMLFLREVKNKGQKCLQMLMGAVSRF